jgi:2-polyprenyl-3-methyl-5-hydroxy-6-metoxy-1,4-benzoquinol methylase
MNQTLAESRRIASEKSGGTSNDNIKRLVLKLLQQEQAKGSLLDYGAGKAELLQQLAQSGGFDTLAGADLFPRSAELPSSIQWYQQDLNDPLQIGETFDVVVCSETIEHLENPRLVLRNLAQLLKPGGLLVLTMPNQESIRAYLALLINGHFVHFVGANYPAHITALLRLDLVRICAEVGFTPPQFAYTNEGGLP